MLVASGNDPSGGPYQLTFAGGRPARLRGPHDLQVSLVHGYVVVPDGTGRARWVVHGAEYAYTVLTGDGQRVLAYHWHPIGSSAFTQPHVHVYGRTTPIDLRRMHLPTGHVALASALRLLIEEFGVRPLRDDWAARLVGLA